MTFLGGLGIGVGIALGVGLLLVVKEILRILALVVLEVIWKI